MPNELAVWFLERYEIIGVVFLGAMVKIFFSQDLSLGKAIGTGAAAVFAAMAFTPVTIHFLEKWYEVDPDLVKIPVAAVWTLVGEGIMRTFISLSTDHSIIGNWIRRMIGGSNGN